MFKSKDATIPRADPRTAALTSWAQLRQQGLDVRIVAYPMGLHELCTILAHHDGVVDIKCLPQADVVLARFRGHEDVELVLVDIDGCCSISYISCTDPLRHSARPQDC
ncbi:hypothetical protein PTSG_06472 [Salpingoeca rosetta]|uniref:Uncharacterized protein n=1 Tax=Salpingoeca rosetta (strain ATCC 50818 / BSB-021) TaxID=946362 RepID=F2UFW7_SALR5|nr:uncharacterized protein PTSG_06472 [Salpingoeca rosetta]EGD75395.1 hypothetical protein PTSG_06472 [Salpingoeca rosetta]|eukprot:XP_004991852.1 hypothetical protein PTSG_06472 [Salpingoeca rosetta]